MPASFSLGDRGIGPHKPPYIIAEMSGNHGGRIETAFALIEAAKEAGADAIKFQTYEADTITLNCDAPAFRVQEKLWAGQRLYDLYKQAQTPFAWHKDLFAKAHEVGITAFSAPFDGSALDLLEALECPFYKIASCELVDIPLLEMVGATGKPVILSTGMATHAEITEALEALRNSGCNNIALLHCISGYPTPPCAANITTLAYLSETYDVPVGISDHSVGISVPVAATALGARIIEKHFCLDLSSGTVDGAFSLDPHAFKQMVDACHDAFAALGSPVTKPTDAEADSLRFRKSLYIAEDVTAGQPLTEKSVRSVRPAGGLHSRHLKEVIGQKLLVDTAAGTPLSWDMLEGGGNKTC